MFSSPMDKAFFSDMLANGIPVKAETDMLSLFEEFEKASETLDFFDIDFANQSLLFSERNGPAVIAVRKEYSDGVYKLLFFTGDLDASMEYAQLIGKILYLMVSFCIELQVFEMLEPLTSNNTDEEFDFESDFV